MSLSPKDAQLLMHILRYCDEINMTLNHFGKNKDIFLQNPIYRNACAMPLLQIGELAKRLSEIFVQTYTDIPWKQIKGMRDFFAHDYQSMDREIVWSAVTVDIPELAVKLKEIIRLGKVPER